MRTAILVSILLSGACANKNNQSLVLSGKVSEYPGTGTPVCPWIPIVSVRARATAVWINELEYDLAEPLREKSFLRLIEPCDLPNASSAFMAWREHLEQTDEDEPDRPLSHVSVGSDGQEMVPVRERQELGLTRSPIVKPREASPDTEGERLRIAFERALLPGAPDPSSPADTTP